MYKKIVIFAVFLLLSLSQRISAEGCSDNDIILIHTCFLKTFSQTFHLDLNNVPGSTVFQDFNNIIKTDYAGISKICDGIKEIQTCLSQSIINNCFNIDDFMRVAFVKNQISIRQNSRYFVTLYFITNYGCNQGYQTLSKNHECIGKTSYNCSVFVNNDGCEAPGKLSNCISDKITTNCGKAAGCLEKKFQMLEWCVTLDSCLECNPLKAQNNFFDNLCSDEDGNANNGGNFTLKENMLSILNMVFVVFYFFPNKNF